MLRYAGEWSKMLFPPGRNAPVSPTPARETIRSTANYFAQVWYVLEGEFKIGGEVCCPGTIIYRSSAALKQEVDAVRTIPWPH